MRRLIRAVQLYFRSNYTWHAAWHMQRSIDGWHTVADEEGNVLIVPGTMPF